MLRSELDGQSYYAAGLPWFATLFGRDSLITAFETLSFVPGRGRGHAAAARGRLGTRGERRARRGARARCSTSCAWASPRRSARRPFARYYGSVDATPLFLCLLGSYADWCGQPRPLPRAARAGRGGARVDRPLRRPRRRRPRRVPAPLAARARDPGVEGLGRRRPRRRRGAARAADRARGGAGLRGARQAHDGAAVRAGRRRCACRAPARRGRARWRRRSSASGATDEGCYAIGLDADKRPGSGLTSNQGHLLWAGAVNDERAGCIRDVLMGSDMFSGWGIRTLAQSHPAYNPVGLPHRLGVAARQRADRVRPAPLRLRRGLHADLRGAARGRLALQRLPPAGALRRVLARGVRRARALPRRLPAAGVGGRLDPVPAQVGPRPQPGRAREAAPDHPPLPAALAGAGGRDGRRDRRTRAWTCASSGPATESR